MATQRKPEVPTGEQFGAYLKAAGQDPGSTTYTIRGALEAIYLWGYQDGLGDAGIKAEWEREQVAAEDLERRFPEGSTDSKFNRTDGE